MQFDFGKQVSYTGVVKDFAAINPHMRLVVELKNANGSGTHTVRFEGHSTNNMYRSGYRKGMVKVGDTITVNAAPFRDGTEGGYVISASLADGRFFGMQSRSQREAQAAGAFFERTERLGHAIAGYLRAPLPLADRRNVALYDRRGMFRGGRRAADHAAMV